MTAEDKAEQLTEAVITCLNAYAMPLIRYKIGDICSFIERDCPCGCSFPLIGPAIGRTDDIFALPSGRLLSPISLGIIIRRFPHYRQYRFTQESERAFLLEINFDGPAGESDILALQQQIGAYLAEPVELRVHRVAGFEKDGLKFRPFVSKLRRAIDLHRADNLPEHRQ
jgi:phenylacetate-CoA ligase